MANKSNAVQSPLTSPKCHERRHMTALEFTVYDIARAWSATSSTDPKYKGKNILYLNGPKMAAESESLCKATVYKVIKSLEAKGWLVKVQASHWANGQRTSTHFRVIHHAEWAKRHGDKCVYTKAAKYAERADFNEESQSPIETTKSPLRNQLSPIETTKSPLRNILSPQKAIACVYQPVNEHVKKPVELAGSAASVAGSAVPSILSVPSLGTLTDGKATTAGSQSPLQTNSEIIFRGVDQGYFDARTGKPLYYAELNERVSPNTYNGGEFFDPQGNKISLDEAQGKVLVKA
jgi:hypothetical protein